MRKLKQNYIYLLLIPFVLCLVSVYGLKLFFAAPLFAAGCLAARKIRRYRLVQKDYEFSYFQVTTYLEIGRAHV